PTSRHFGREGEAIGDGLMARGLGSVGGRTLSARDSPLLTKAREARDALARELNPMKGDAPPTITAGYNTRTGQVAARACGGGKCAENHVEEALGGNKAEIRFTEAMRPRNYVEVPVCPRCEATYGREAFPPYTLFKSDF